MAGRQPEVFQCTRCANARYAAEGRANRVTFTGREKPLSRAKGMPPKTSMEYECSDCGFVGWSSHPDLVRKKLMAEVLG